MKESGLPQARYQKPAPPHWDALNALANESLHAGHSPEAVVYTTWNRLGELDLEEVDRLRYRGLGAATCSVVRPLADKNLQATFVEEAVETFIEQHADYCRRPRPGEENINSRKGLYLGEVLGTPSYVLGNLPAIFDSYNALPAGTRLLTNTAIAATTYASDQRQAPLAQGTLRDIVETDMAFEQVTAAFSNGASMVLAAELGRRRAARHQSEPAAEPASWAQDEHLLVKEAVSCQELRSVDNLQKVGKLAAGLRLDEIEMERFYTLVQRRSTGIYIDPRNIPQPPKPVNRNRHNVTRLPHESRLQCPARPVEGAVPLAVRLTVEIVGETQHRLLGNVHHLWEKLTSRY